MFPYIPSKAKAAMQRTDAALAEWFSAQIADTLSDNQLLYRWRAVYGQVDLWASRLSEYIRTIPLCLDDVTGLDADFSDRPDYKAEVIVYHYALAAVFATYLRWQNAYLTRLQSILEDDPAASDIPLFLDATALSFALLGYSLSPDIYTILPNLYTLSPNPSSLPSNPSSLSPNLSIPEQTCYDELNSRGFFSIDKVRILSPAAQRQLVQRLVQAHGIPFAMALFYVLDYHTHFRKIVDTDNYRARFYSHIARALSQPNPDTIKRNWNTILNPDSNDCFKYSAYKHLPDARAFYASLTPTPNLP